MSHRRFAFILFAVVLGAALTVWVAASVMTDQVWAWALLPVLGLALLVHWRRS